MKMLTFMIALIAVIQLSACNTMRGVGKDVQSGGRAIEKSAD
ncbi:entericidin B [Nitrosomonas sp. Nm166]|nr:entericidin B [Nitrosomonas sp. Nm166]